MWKFGNVAAVAVAAVSLTFSTIGLDQELGSIEKGKLADSIVMDKNPLENIRNTETIRMVMLNGRLYAATTLAEIGTRMRERLEFPWER
jgi:imidazolonepropionase-like amidohydrolase